MPSQQLIDFITQQLQKGVLSKEKIKEILLGAGWQEKDVDEAFSLVSSPAGQPEQPSASVPQALATPSAVPPLYLFL